MKELQIFLILSPAILLIVLVSFLMSQLIKKINKKYAGYPTYWLVLFISGLGIIFLSLFYKTSYFSLMFGVAASTSAAFLKYKKLKNK